MAAAEENFQRLVAQLDYPMFIATVATDEERAGCLIGFATQCSIHPPRFLAGHLRQEPHDRVAKGAASMAIHLVPEDASELAELFGGETGDELDKFERYSWRPGPEGVPLLDDCPNRFVGRILERVDFGDHTGMVLEPVFAEVEEARRPAQLPPSQAHRARTRSLSDRHGDQRRGDPGRHTRSACSLGGRLPEGLQRRVLAGLGLVTLVIGVDLALAWRDTSPLYVLGGVLLGGLAGEALGIEARLAGARRPDPAPRARGARRRLVAGERGVLQREPAVLRGPARGGRARSRTA